MGEPKPLNHNEVLDSLPENVALVLKQFIYNLNNTKDDKYNATSEFSVEEHTT